MSPLTEDNDRIANLDLSPGVLNPALGTPAVAVVLPGQAGAIQRQPARQPGAAGPQQFCAARRVRLEAVFENRGARRIWHQLQHGRLSGDGAAAGVPAAIFDHADQHPDRRWRSHAAERFSRVVDLGITNNYAVNPNYRLGYVQIRNLDIQQQIRPTLLLNIDYTGTKGTDLDILEAPNRTATGIRIPDVQAFTYENSVGDLEANAGSVRLRKRLSNGFSIGGIYTFSKSIDNASSIGAGATSGSGRAVWARAEPVPGGGGGSSGGGAANVAQNAFDLSAERGLSSFNQTQKFTADYLWELPFGHDKRWLTGNTPLRAIFGDWQWSGDWTFASGLAVHSAAAGKFCRVEPRNQRHAAA